MLGVVNLQNGHNYTVPNKPPDHLILNYDKPEAEQYWERILLPENLYDITRPERTKIIDRHWEYYYNGCWFYNNGDPVYLPGRAWFFFNWWSGAFNTVDKFPQFRMEQLLYYYFKELAVSDKKCLGTFKFKQRRDGATLMEVCDQIYEAIQSEKKNFGIISMTNDAAFDVCWTKMMMGFRPLPKFFKPAMTGTDDPKKRLVFDRPAKRLTIGNYDKEDRKLFNGKKIDGFQSRLSFKSTKTNSYDGETMYRLLLDEFCKFPSNVSPAQTLYTHIPCIMQHQLKVGMINIITSPAERPCQAFDETLQLWKDSDYEDLQDNGATKSGFWRWFSPTHKNAETEKADGVVIPFIDKYGYCDEQRAKEWVLSERKKCSTSQQLRSKIMQYPLHIDEIVDAVNEASVFTSHKEITKRKQFLQINSYKDEPQNEPKWVHGNLLWKDGIPDTEVVWLPSQRQSEYTETGRWRIAYMPRDTEVNRVIIKGDRKMPHKDSEMVMGVDPYDHRIVSGNKHASKGVAFTLKCLDFLNLKERNRVYIEYCFRPRPENFYEDMIKQAFFFGAYVQVESQNKKIIDHFEDRGYWEFLLDKDIYKKEGMKGNPASAQLIQEFCAIIDAYCSEPLDPLEKNNLSDFWFEDLLEELCTFDPANTKKFDRVIAFGQTLLGARKRQLLKGKPKNQSLFVKNLISYIYDDDEG